MKGFFVAMLALFVWEGADLSAQPVGKSMGRWKDLSAESMKANHEGGLEYIEVTINDFWRPAKSHEEIYERAERARAWIEASGLKVWSVHLPYSRTLDISVLDDEARAENVAFMKEMIALAGRFHPQRLVLHPSSEPIAEEERNERLENSHRSIGLLAPEAERIGAVLCVENLPRTCLGQTGEEMLRLIEGYDGVMLCFDTNHLFYQSHADYLKAVGNRIGTVHLSDYDLENECHWIPGRGKINWGELWNGILRSGYDGILMFECYGEPAELLEARTLILESAQKERRHVE